tara:strand:- start:1722 stop:3341 length:1620 start_codon:yes stop_codon:yes gene_type:complete
MINTKNITMVTTSIFLFLFFCTAVQSQGEKKSFYAPYSLEIDTVIDTLEGYEFSLPDLITIALQNNISIKSSKLTADQYKGGVISSKGVFFPSLTVSEQYQVDNLPTQYDFSAYGYGNPVDYSLEKVTSLNINQLLGGIGTSFSFNLQTTKFDNIFQSEASDSLVTALTNAALLPERPQYTSVVTMGLAQPLLDGFNMGKISLKQAINNSDAWDSRYKREIENTISRIEIAYWSLGEVEAREVVYRKSLKVAQELLDRNKNLNRLNLLTDLDVITAESGYQMRLSNLLQSQLSRENASEQFMYLVYGKKAPEIIKENSHLIKTNPVLLTIPTRLNLDDLVLHAFKNRKDLEAVKLDLTNYSLSLKKTKNALLPNLDLTIQGYTNNTTIDVDEKFTNLDQNYDWFFQLQFTHYLFNKVDKGAYYSALAAQQQSEYTVLDLENYIRMELGIALRTLDTEIKRMEYAEKAAIAARKQLDYETKSLELGLSNSFRVLQTEEMTASAELTAISARVAVAKSISNYYHVLGDIGSKYLISSGTVE